MFSHSPPHLLKANWTVTYGVFPVDSKLSQSGLEGGELSQEQWSAPGPL
jgi:hypothetical protein